MYALLIFTTQQKINDSFQGYPQLNVFGLPIKSKPGLEKNVFALGDWRSNQDWLLMTYHILFLREHNRLCDILKEQHPTWDDEKLFQTARVAVTMKFMVPERKLTLQIRC